MDPSSCAIMILSNTDKNRCKGDLRRFLYAQRKDVTALTERQRKFAEYYVQCGNAEQAAVSAGYSEQYARGNAYKLVANSGVAAYIKQLSEAAQTARIMTARGRQELLSDIARDEDNAAADRIRAVDTLNKMTGEYTTKVEASVQKNPFAELTTEELRKVIGSG